MIMPRYTLPIAMTIQMIACLIIAHFWPPKYGYWPWVLIAGLSIAVLWIIDFRDRKHS